MAKLDVREVSTTTAVSSVAAMTAAAATVGRPVLCLGLSVSPALFLILRTASEGQIYYPDPMYREPTDLRGLPADPGAASLSVGIACRHGPV